MVCLCAGTGCDLAVAPTPRPPAPPRKEEDTGPEAPMGEALALAMSFPDVGGRTVRSNLSRPVRAGKGGAAAAVAAVAAAAVLAALVAAEETEGSMPLRLSVLLRASAEGGKAGGEMCWWWWRWW